MRYTSKNELVSDIVAEHQALQYVLEAIPAATCIESGVWGDEWSIADLLSHLSAWHGIFLRCVKDALFWLK